MFLRQGSPWKVGLRNPILVNLKRQGAPMISPSVFFNAHIPAEIHEINLKNLAAIDPGQ